MKQRSYLEVKGREVKNAEKWAKGIRLGALAISVVFACIILFRTFQTVFYYDELRDEYAKRGLTENQIEVEVPSNISVFFDNVIDLVIVDTPIILGSYFAAMLLELRAADVHNKEIMANCALFNVYEANCEKDSKGKADEGEETENEG